MKSKLNVIYVDGDFDATKPGTFLVELRRWECKKTGDVDYVLETTIAINERSDEQLALLSTHSFFKTNTTTEIVIAADDGRAIRKAVERYYEVGKQAGAFAS